MLRPPACLFVKPVRSAACLIAGGAFLCLMGGLAAPGSTTIAEPAVRHAAARQASEHLDSLRSLTIGLARGTGADIRLARAALGADMIALRELAVPGEETTALGDTLATLALYQAAWGDARDWARSGDPDGARQALDAAIPLADHAEAALASLGHVIDAGNVVAEDARRTAERDRRLRYAGVALLVAGALLLWVGQPETLPLKAGRHPAG
jgi:hypothetical protein